MKQRRRLKKSEQVVARRDPRAKKRTSRRPLRKKSLEWPVCRPDDLSIEDRREREKKLSGLLSQARQDLEAHFGLREEHEPFLWATADHFMYEWTLPQFIPSAGIPLIGHDFSREFGWLGQSQILCLSELDAAVMRAEEEDSADSWWSEYYVFGEKGELLRDACLKTPPAFSRIRELFEKDAAGLRVLSRAPTLVRMPNEQRPLTADEVWGIMGALMRAFVSLRPSLYKLSDERTLDELYSLELDVRRLAAQLRQTEASSWRTEDTDSEVLEILCERYASKLKHIGYQLDGKKQKVALVRFMGPCVACFELLFGVRANGGGDYKPTPFTLFVASFLAYMGLPSSYRTVRTYFQKWKKLGHRARPAE